MAMPQKLSSLGETLSSNDKNLNPRFEAPNILLRHGISCAVWGEDALWHYGVRTVCFDLFLLVEESEAAGQCLKSAGYSCAPSNPRYKFIPELYVLQRFRKMHPDEMEGRAGFCVALLQAQNCCYSLLPADAVKHLVPPHPLLVDSIIDAWMDATSIDYAMHLAMHLSYLQDYNAEARDPSFAKELKPEHQEFYLRSLWYEAIQAEREKWKHVRDSFPMAT